MGKAANRTLAEGNLPQAMVPRQVRGNDARRSRQQRGVVLPGVRRHAVRQARRRAPGSPRQGISIDYLSQAALPPSSRPLFFFFFFSSSSDAALASFSSPASVSKSSAFVSLYHRLRRRRQTLQITNRRAAWDYSATFIVCVCSLSLDYYCILLRDQSPAMPSAVSSAMYASHWGLWRVWMGDMGDE